MGNQNEGGKIQNYNLVSVAEHQVVRDKTGHTMGHYVSYCLRNGSWFMFNDEQVDKKDWDDIKNREAYILIYSVT